MCSRVQSKRGEKRRCGGGGGCGRGVHSGVMTLKTLVC